MNFNYKCIAYSGTATGMFERGGVTENMVIKIGQKSRAGLDPLSISFFSHILSSKRIAK